MSTTATTTASGGSGDGSVATDRSTAAATAATKVYEGHSITVDLPGLGRFYLPSSFDQIGFLGGVAALAALGIVDWPVAGVLAVGHVLAHNRHHAVLRAFGEALDQA